MATATRTKTAVYTMVEDEWLVRGTLDPMEAVRLIVDEMTETLLRDVSPDRPNPISASDKVTVDCLTEFLYGLLEKARPGLYRKNPVGPGQYGHHDGWAWQIGYAKERGPGVFEGVYF